jgi:hypothetical protein
MGTTFFSRATCLSRRWRASSGGVGGEIAKDAGEFVAALGAMREMVRDDGGFFGGEQLHGVEHQVVGLGMARAAGVGGAERRVGHDCRAHG